MLWFGRLVVVMCLFASAAVLAESAPPPNFPPVLRWDFVPKWIEWTGKDARVRWPPNDGCAEQPSTTTLPPGTIIERFGSEGGTFFNPRGATATLVSLPYVCRKIDFREYKVLKPLQVRSCHVAPWFDQPGGALQYQSSDPAFILVKQGALQMTSAQPAGSNGPAPQCGG